MREVWWPTSRIRGLVGSSADGSRAKTKTVSALFQHSAPCGTSGVYEESPNMARTMQERSWYVNKSIVSILQTNTQTEIVCSLHIYRHVGVKVEREGSPRDPRRDFNHKLLAMHHHHLNYKLTSYPAVRPLS